MKMENAQPSVAAMKCGKCGTAGRPGDRFCRKDGEKLETDIHCGGCGQKAPAGDLYCGNCGGALSEEIQMKKVQG